MNNICLVKDCSEFVSAITKNNLNYSKKFCEKHSKSVECNCHICKEKIIIKPRYYELNKEYNCHKCSSKINLQKTRSKESSIKRIGSMKKNGTFEKWQKSCHSTESKILGYKNMVENGNVNNLIKASNTTEIIKKKQENRIKSGGFDKFMKAGHQKTKELWQNNEEYRNMQLKNLNSLPNFIKDNFGNKLYLNPINLRYESWDNYKIKFKIKEYKKLKDYNTLIIPTFRYQNSNSWKKSRQAFEQYLVDNNIIWFVYIKFYINKNIESKPLVVGKTGSKLINASGSDVVFDLKDSGGPARQFLNDYNLNWDKTKILIIKAESKLQALKIESEISTKYELFNS